MDWDSISDGSDESLESVESGGDDDSCCSLDSADMESMEEELESYQGEHNKDFCEGMVLLGGQSRSRDIEEDDAEEDDNVVSVTLPAELCWDEPSLDAYRREESVRFCRELLNDVRLTKYERDHMRCEPEYHLERRRRHRPHQCTIPLRPVPSLRGADIDDGGGEDDEMQLDIPITTVTIWPKHQRLCYSNQQALLDALSAGEEKKIYTVTMHKNKVTLRFIVENYVHVTYFVNSLTGELCKFSLVDLANKLQHYFVEYSCKKFAKVNMRIRGALSFLLYTSSVLVETGSDNQLLSRLLLQFVVTVLRQECGYPHINIKRRKCQNIVATGKLNYNICMNVLKHKFQAAREKEHFSGLVIKHRDLVKFFQQLDGPDEDGYQLMKTANYVDDGDDGEVIGQINRVNDEAVVRQLSGGCENNDNGDTEQRVAARQGYILNEYGVEEEEEEAIRRILRLTDEYDTGMLSNSTRQNGTHIVFEQGQFISTGCKNDEELHDSMPMLMRLTYMCRQSDPKNRELEANLVALKKGNSATQAAK